MYIYLPMKVFGEIDDEYRGGPGEFGFRFAGGTVAETTDDREKEIIKEDTSAPVWSSLTNRKRDLKFFAKLRSLWLIFPSPDKFSTNLFVTYHVKWVYSNVLKE